MFILGIAGNFAKNINELGFLVALILCTLFYKEYKRQLLQMQHDDMIDRFLND